MNKLEQTIYDRWAKQDCATVIECKQQLPGPFAISTLQRLLKWGFNRTCRTVQQLVDSGVIVKDGHNFKFK